MRKRILVSTTSFLDTPGAHREALKSTGYEVVAARGPLSEENFLDLISNHEQFDGFLCGEDVFSKRVLEAITPRAKVISKYGVGLDKVDLEAAAKLGIEVRHTPRVNHTTVSELTFGLLLSLTRRIPEHNSAVHRANWHRLTGVELTGKTLGVIGLGRVGKEVVKRGLAFGMKVLVYNTNWSAAHMAFVEEMTRVFGSAEFSEYPPSVRYVSPVEDLLRAADFVTLHMNFSKENRSFLDRHRLNLCKRGSYIVNVSRGALVDHVAMAEAIKKGHIAGYGADVLDPEPVTPENPLLGIPEVVLTPHIGSRTYDSVARQGLAALENIVTVLG